MDLLGAARCLHSCFVAPEMLKSGKLERQYLTFFLGEICRTDRLESPQVLCVGTDSPNAQHSPSSTYLVWVGAWGTEHMLWGMVFVLLAMVVVLWEPLWSGNS